MAGLDTANLALAADLATWWFYALSPELNFVNLLDVCFLRILKSGNVFWTTSILSITCVREPDLYCISPTEGTVEVLIFNLKGSHDFSRVRDSNRCACLK